MLKNIFPLFITLFLVSITTITAQEQSDEAIAQLVEEYKNDRRGPYYRIKWFCKDGTIREPKDPCPDETGGGNQHATFKKNALKLRETNHLFFGEILTGLKHEEFLDTENHQSRLKQYQLNKYLASVDDGWILRRGQYYRGALQSEDETAWGKKFLLWLLKDDDFLQKNYYVTRQLLRDLPHNNDTNLAQEMRSDSKILAEKHSNFMDVRIKIHGQPQPTDIQLVEAYLRENASKLSSKEKEQFDELLKTMRAFYAPVDFNELAKNVESLPKNNATESLLNFLNRNTRGDAAEVLVTEISKVLYDIRTGITDYDKAKDRLTVLDISNILESALLIQVQQWDTETVQDNLNKIHALACASAGTGLLEEWEYGTIQNNLAQFKEKDKLSVGELNTLLDTGRSVVEWNASMVKANYQDIVDTYAGFEPLAYGFIDDRIRSSVALSLGDEVSRLGTYVSAESNINNKVMNIGGQSAVRGLNPGYAYGKLVVVSGNPENVEVNTNNIYIFQKPPSDLKPVAGIMTVSEGNLVSHVQLLARNLGIPNAALSDQNLRDLQKYNGEYVFYAVSNKGNVILKTADQMTNSEKKLFTKKEKNTNIITVPTDEIVLSTQKVVNMRDVDADDSGKLCGPKAANLGELKQMFPDHVVEGLIIPFGIFKKHMEQSMPGENGTYWDYLNKTFADAKMMRSQGKSTQEVESFQLESLQKLHNAIIKMPLDKSFVSDVKAQFNSVFGDAIGNVPVFLRSDTNMEDLEEFTGAGLNLTLFNILSEEEIMKGIKRVWASPYTERSFKWRQKYLSNPENVYPSILIIPSVDVDYSGVMITKGINSGNDDDLTVAFSRGAGGAVDGQRAETRLITKNSDFLLTPAREDDYIRLPKTGNTKSYKATFEAPILNQQNINEIRELGNTIRKKMPRGQAYDVEFGFLNNKLWLFQIRPFVENENAKSSEYLESITPKINTNKDIRLSEKI